MMKPRVGIHNKNVASQLFSVYIDPGITITKNAAAISKLDVTKGDIVLCGSPKGDFGPTWKFPNGTDVPEQNSATISQADGASGYKELRLSPLTSTPPNGQYKCQYTANNITETKTVDLTFTGTLRLICVARSFGLFCS